MTVPFVIALVVLLLLLVALSIGIRWRDDRPDASRGRDEWLRRRRQEFDRDETSLLPREEEDAQR